MRFVLFQLEWRMWSTWRMCLVDEMRLAFFSLAPFGSSMLLRWNYVYIWLKHKTGEKRPAAAGIIEACASQRISIDWLDHSSKYLLIEFVAGFDFARSLRSRLYYFNKDVIIRCEEIEYFADDNDCRQRKSLASLRVMAVRPFPAVSFSSRCFNLFAHTNNQQ